MQEPAKSPPPAPDPSSQADQRVRDLLQAAAAGRPQAADDLLPIVYEQLRRTAAKFLTQDRAGHTLQPTALVHEAYARLVGSEQFDWAGRGHFFSAAAVAMQRVLVEHARAKARLKRGGDGERPVRRVSLDDAEPAIFTDCERFLMLDEALRRLEEQDPQAAEVVRLRYFAGLSVPETAAAMGVSTSTVDREWAYAKARLHRAMRESGP